MRRGQRARLHESRRPKLGFFGLHAYEASKSVIMSNTLSSLWIQQRMQLFQKKAYVRWESSIIYTQKMCRHKQVKKNTVVKYTKHKKK